MANVIDYVVKNAKYTFKEKPFSHVDALVLAQLSFIDYTNVGSLLDHQESVSIQDAIKALNLNDIQISIINGGKNKRLLLAVASSIRYAHLKLNYYVNHIDEDDEKQFCAVTYFLDDLTYIAYRGTDESIIGWKEDFNMLFKSPIPAQLDGVSYAETVLEKVEGDIYLGGHSKGGNIAIYSAMNVTDRIRDKIHRIYSFDGPGFRSEIFNSKEYAEIEDRIHKFMPQSSIVGILFESEDDYTIVQSKNIWITQHDIFSWMIRNDDFRYMSRPNKTLMRMNHKFNAWIDSLNEEDKERFVESIYNIYKGCDARTIDCFVQQWKHHAKNIMKEIKNVDKETRNFILKTIGSMFVFLVKSNKNKQKGEVLKS